MLGQFFFTLQDAEDVDPEEGTASDVDHSHGRGKQEKVDGLSWHPKHAAFLQ